MKGQRRWYDPTWQRERQRHELERHATQLIKAAARKEVTLRDKRACPRKMEDLREVPAMPRRYTLADLGKLRRLGRLP